MSNDNQFGYCYCMAVSNPPSFIRVQWWFVPLPYGILIFVYDEIRKLGVRRHPGSKFIYVLSTSELM